MNQPLTQSKTTKKSSTPQTITVPAPGVTGTPRPAHAEIAKRAYEIYLHKGRLQGQCERNWLQAEQELRKQRLAASPSKASVGAPAVTPSHSSGSR